jgi:hypothetical protein
VKFAVNPRLNALSCYTAGAPTVNFGSDQMIMSYEQRQERDGHRGIDIIPTKQATLREQRTPGHP